MVKSSPLNERSVWWSAGSLLLSSHDNERERNEEWEWEARRGSYQKAHRAYSSFWTLQVNSVSKDSTGTKHKQAASNKEMQVRGACTQRERNLLKCSLSLPLSLTLLTLAKYTGNNFKKQEYQIFSSFLYSPSLWASIILYPFLYFVCTFSVSLYFAFHPWNWILWVVS